MTGENVDSVFVCWQGADYADEVACCFDLFVVCFFFVCSLGKQFDLREFILCEVQHPREGGLFNQFEQADILS